jgi:hypothetical protein
MAGEFDAAYQAYELAGRRTTSLPERRYLEARAERLPMIARAKMQGSIPR